MIEIPILGHGLFPWQSAVVEGVHVDDLLRFHHDGRLGLVFEPALALEGNPQLVHHGAAEGPLQRETEKREQNGFQTASPFRMLWTREQTRSPPWAASFCSPPQSPITPLLTQLRAATEDGEIYSVAGWE